MTCRPFPIKTTIFIHHQDFNLWNIYIMELIVNLSVILFLSGFGCMPGIGEECAGRRSANMRPLLRERGKRKADAVCHNSGQPSCTLAVCVDLSRTV